MADGITLCIVPDRHMAQRIRARGRSLEVWTTEEVATAVAALPAPLRALKRHFGGIVEALQVDPNALQAAGSQADFDDPIPF